MGMGTKPPAQGNMPQQSPAPTPGQAPGGKGSANAYKPQQQQGSVLQQQRNQAVGEPQGAPQTPQTTITPPKPTGERMYANTSPQNNNQTQKPMSGQGGK